MKRTSNIRRPRYSEQILPVPCPFVISRFHKSWSRFSSQYVINKPAKVKLEPPCTMKLHWKIDLRDRLDHRATSLSHSFPSVSPWHRISSIPDRVSTRNLWSTMKIQKTLNYEFSGAKTEPTLNTHTHWTLVLRWENPSVFASLRIYN